MKRTYDPALRKTPVGKHLYYHWKTMRKNPHTEEWDLFQNFYEWAVNSGCTPEAKLCLIDAALPYSPDNCEWNTKADEEAIDQERVAAWNKAVNRIRKHYGMPPLEGTSYGDN